MYDSPKCTINDPAPKTTSKTITITKPVYCGYSGHPLSFIKGYTMGSQRLFLRHNRNT